MDPEVSLKKVQERYRSDLTARLTTEGSTVVTSEEVRSFLFVPAGIRIGED